MAIGLNSDFSRFVAMRTKSMDWQASPSRGVWRKRLDLAGDSESSRVTSLVRYDAGSHFPPHPHPDGEEILVLDGVFSDETGDYPSGSFLLNPDGFVHSPYSLEGCTLFVKLRQYGGRDRTRVIMDTRTARWHGGLEAGSAYLPLYRDMHHPELIDLVRLEEGADLKPRLQRGGAELLVLRGDLEAQGEAYEANDWIRFPAGVSLRLASRQGTEFYLKRGHLA
jgi:redox-sensitive bicupin YhaK (pirin superfamily)